MVQPKNAPAAAAAAAAAASAAPSNVSKADAMHTRTIYGIVNMITDELKRSRINDPVKYLRDVVDILWLPSDRVDMSVANRRLWERAVSLIVSKKYDLLAILYDWDVYANANDTHTHTDTDTDTDTDTM